MPSAFAISAWVSLRSRRSWRSCGPTKVFAIGAQEIYNPTDLRVLYADNQHINPNKNASSRDRCYLFCQESTHRRAQRKGSGPMASRISASTSAHRILILGASYGSLFATKCLMAGYDVTLVCRGATAELINTRGTEVRIRLKGEETHRAIRSAALPGRLDADMPEDVDPAGYD